jgi:N-dimethylarginine dimethylaminohydrolase
VVDGNRLITHSLTPDLKAELESITKKKIHMVDTSEFEKSGGSVRCMTLDILNQYKQ